jgi:hypothetical protein
MTELEKRIKKSQRQLAKIEKLIEKEKADFSVGDRISHRFGLGTIERYTPYQGANCFWVQFDSGAHCWVAAVRLKHVEVTK